MCIRDSGVTDADYFKRAFNTVQDHIKAGKISAGHDIGSGGLITSLLELCFPSLNIGMDLDFSCFEETDLVKILFSEKVGLILQSNFDLNSSFSKNGIKASKIGFVNQSSSLKIGDNNISINEMRKEWMKTSTQFELKQTDSELALLRLDNVINSL